MQQISVYLVGGAVRDALLGLPMQDRDWVVVGSTPEQMLRLGFIQVGNDFPIFLHPTTKEEFALARTERKTHKGYTGFVTHSSPQVRIEDDLLRRDLTINAIALGPITILESNTLQNVQSATDSNSENDAYLMKIIEICNSLNNHQLMQLPTVDCYGGVHDIHTKTLRHVSAAFSEDPVRMLRLARFAARLNDFHVEPTTMRMLKSLVNNGEINHLVPERVWQELSKGLMTPQPSRMFDVLRQCGALRFLLPELDALWGVPQRAQYHPEIDAGVHTMMTLDLAATEDAPLAVRFACLVHDLGKALTPKAVLPRHIAHDMQGLAPIKTVCKNLRVPTDITELALAVCREHINIHSSLSFNANAVERLLQRCDAYRKPERFEHILHACECDARGRLGMQKTTYPQRQRLKNALKAAQSVTTKTIAQQATSQGLYGQAIAHAIAQARTKAIAAAL